MVLVCCTNPAEIELGAWMASMEAFAREKSCSVDGLELLSYPDHKA